MKVIRRVAVVGVAVGALGLMAAAPAPSGKTKLEVAVAALSGRVLTKSELDKIYSGRTWYWKDGAAYFQPDQRFRAWVKKGVETTYGFGSWSVSNNGQLCIRATWRSLSGSTKAFTCYVHRTSDAIYQRELPRGSWYVFSHLPKQPGDEINKLENGDHVWADYLRASRYVIKNSRNQQRIVPKPGAERPH